MVKNKSALIVAVCDVDSSPGVFYKYDGIARSSNDSFNISLKSYKPGYKLKYLKILLDSFSYNTDIVLFRSNLQFSPLLCFIFLVLKLKSIRVICEVPTPYYSHLKTTKSIFDRICYYFFIPIMFLLCNKIVCYAEEKGYLNFFSKKMKLLGNGILVRDMEVKTHSNTINENLNIVGAATIASWHGWEYVIRARAKIKLATGMNVIFHVIGDGPEKNNLIKLSETLNIESNIIFYGMKPRRLVHSIYNICQLGVGTFNWKQLEITEASPLKYREYSSVGLPFLYSTLDPDYENTDVAFLIDEDDPVANIKDQLLKIIKSNNLPSPKECNEYALQNLDFSKKLNDLF